MKMSINSASNLKLSRGRGCAEELFVHAGEGHLAGDVVSLLLVGGVDDAALLFVGKDSCGGFGAVGAIEFDEGKLDFADVIAAGAGGDARLVGDGCGIELGVALEEWGLQGHDLRPLGLNSPLRMRGAAME